MCQKNDYTRRAITTALAILTALLVFGAAQTDAQVAQNGSYRLEQAVIASGGGTSADASGNVYKLEGTIGEPVAGTTSTSPTISVKGGFLAASAPLAPTAAPVSVSGRVLTLDGSGLMNAQVTITTMSGAARTVLTQKMGAFRFDDLEAGETYVISVRSRRYTFQPQVVSLLENTSELIITAQEAYTPLKSAP